MGARRVQIPFEEIFGALGLMKKQHVVLWMWKPQMVCLPAVECLHHVEHPSSFDEVLLGTVGNMTGTHLEHSFESCSSPSSSLT